MDIHEARKLGFTRQSQLAQLVYATLKNAQAHDAIGVLPMLLIDAVQPNLRHFVHRGLYLQVKGEASKERGRFDTTQMWLQTLDYEMELRQKFATSRICPRTRQEAFINALIANPIVTRHDVAALTNVSLVTVGRWFQRLKKTDLFRAIQIGNVIFVLQRQLVCIAIEAAADIIGMTGKNYDTSEIWRQAVKIEMISWRNPKHPYAGRSR